MANPALTPGSAPGSPEPDPAPAAVPARPGLERLELRIERLNVTLRFTFAFHAREVRFERDEGRGFERIFPETFSFRVAQHDPTELFLQLDDLLHKTDLVSQRANRRDARGLVGRLLSEAPSYLERVVSRLDEEGRLADRQRLQLHQDAALLAQILLRFLETRDLESGRSQELAAWVLKRRVALSLCELLHERVAPDYLEAYVRGEVDPVVPGDDPTESGFFHALEGSDGELADRLIVRSAERAYYQWLEGVCLDESNQAFETEDSPFDDREHEVLRAVTSRERSRLAFGSDFSPFLRRPGRDSLRLLKQLEIWFLRQYDIRHSSAVIQHAALLRRGVDDSRRALSWHTPRGLRRAARALRPALRRRGRGVRAGAPFLRPLDLGRGGSDQRRGGLVPALELRSPPRSHDLLRVRAADRRRRDRRLSAGVPDRRGLGSGVPLGLHDVRAGVALLGLATLLYIFVEVQRRLGHAGIAFARARAIFLLGVLEAFGLGVLMTSLVGPPHGQPHLVSRRDAELPLETLRTRRVSTRYSASCRAS